MIKKFLKCGIIFALIFQFNDSIARSANYEKVEASTPAERSEAWAHIDKAIAIIKKDHIIIYDKSKMEDGMEEIEDALKHMRIDKKTGQPEMTAEEWKKIWEKMDKGIFLLKQSTEIPNSTSESSMSK